VETGRTKAGYEHTEFAEGMEMKIHQMVKSVRKKRYEMHFKKIKERLISIRGLIFGMGLKVEQIVKSIRQKKLKEPLKLLEAREANVMEMVMFIKKKRFGMHLHKVKRLFDQTWADYYGGGVDCCSFSNHCWWSSTRCSLE